MPVTVPEPEAKALAYRRFIRNYGGFSFRHGRSKIRNWLARFMQTEQLVELQPGWRLALKLKNDRKQFSQDRVFWFHEEYEPSLQWALQNLIPIGGQMLDVGANAGLMGFTAWYHRQAQVLFIEPHPRLADQLRTNIELNQASASVINAAANDVDGEQVFWEHPENDAGHHLLEKDQDASDARTFTIPTRRLDGILNERGIAKIDFLKSDTEGHDLQVLTGLGDFLTPKKLAFLYVEGKSPQIVELLNGRGYRCFQSRKIYIDEWRRIQRSGNYSRLFFAVGDEPGGDCLWCERGSEAEKLLLRLFPADTDQSR
jgi:FkbM family methyltransferase